jgi:hypothetical protein
LFARASVSCLLFEALWNVSMGCCSDPVLACGREADQVELSRDMFTGAILPLFHARRHSQQRQVVNK